MIYSAKITSQGQVTIPAAIRKQLSSDRVIFKVENDSIILQSEPDIMEIAGALQHKAMKNKSINEIMKIEQKAIEEGRRQRYDRKLKENKYTNS